VTRRLALSYVLPLRWADDRGLVELTDYIRFLAGRCEVIVVDASPAPGPERHREAWDGLARVVGARPDLRALNGKARGVLTGVPLAGHDAVVIADDDVRYDDEQLRRVADLLARADLVRPQNHFRPLPWHARWDTARSLVNRAFGADYPGTLGIRRSTFMAMGGYDGDVLFENLELIRTVRAHGGRVASPLDLYVRRIPPTAGHFLGQRVRQAYDDLAQPARLALFLAIAPALAVGGRRLAPVLAGAALLVAEVGRRRAGGRRVFPPGATLFAPVWVAERALCSWAALANRALRGGCPYAGCVIRRAATPRRRLRARARAAT
jgi:hypothetical protein